MKKLMRFRNPIVILLLLAFSITARTATAQQQIPDALLRVTVQQRVDGKLDSAFHVTELRCFNGTCSLTTVTINSCRASPMSKGQASPLVIEKASTQEGTLKVSNDGNTLVAISAGSDIGGDYTTTERFTYEKTETGLIVRRLIGYSGGSVKNSVSLKEVINIEYVPLKEALPQAGHTEVRLNCPLGLPAVTKPLR